MYKQIDNLIVLTFFQYVRQARVHVECQLLL